MGFGGLLGSLFIVLLLFGIIVGGVFGLVIVLLDGIWCFVCGLPRDFAGF